MSCAGWWFNPDWIINELGLNSTITSPTHEEVVTLDQQKDYVVRGYAYSSAYSTQSLPSQCARSARFESSAQSGCAEGRT